MKKTNLGKGFEKCIENSLKPYTSIDRLPDPVGGYSGIRNICDYTCYKYPYNYYLECKCTYENTLNFKSAITEDQWQGLLEKSKYYGVLAGICIWFISYEVTIFVPIQQLEQLKQDGKKSLNIKDINENNELMYFNIPGRKKRTYFDYDGKLFLQELVNLCEQVNKDNGEQI